MIDTTFFFELRTWAADSEMVLTYRASLARAADQHQAAEVADLAGARFGALAELLTSHLDSERARLAAALKDAEQEAIEADERFGVADHATIRLAGWSGLSVTPEQGARIRARQRETEAAAEAAHQAAEAARTALAAFNGAARDGSAE